ncbi:AAEL003782-PA [Aedes aegypti]|uniref:AAEL003782-PA n=1 Tax=Aedes aegypti TaxID=7159 RepID=Q17EI8_AEDAE|nr:AAEL003782-PA [Aedes aegypti]
MNMMPLYGLVVWMGILCTIPTTVSIDIPPYCDHHTTITSQYEDYFNIDEMGNNRTDKNVVDLLLYVQLSNKQEEIALLLSASNRSRQHPDYEKTYEIRISNVYTVIYKETLRMSAHHSHSFNFFPAEHFQLHIKITRKGLITVVIDGLVKPILSVVDENPAIDVHFASFGSRMNAYPITWYFNCRSPPTTSLPETEKPGENEGEDHFSQNDAAELDENKCPVCPKPAKCEVVVRACSDTSQDLLQMSDAEKQKYFFYFNVYLSKNGKNGKAIASGFNNDNKID